jgi:hypothetical protein
MKYELTILERLRLLEILPGHGNILTLRIIGDLQNKIAFSEIELEKYELKQDDKNHIQWNREKGMESAEIELGKKEIEIIKNALEQLNKNERLTQEHIGLWEKFIEDKAPSPDEGKEA